MVETERTTFEVTATGVGRPDYSPAVAASKLITDIHQSTWSVATGAYYGAGTTTDISLYTPAAGHKLTIGALVMSCHVSLIQGAALYYILAGVVTWLVDEFLYDMRGEVVYGAQSAVEVPALADLYIRIQNFDIAQRYITFNVSGFDERVS